MVGEALGHFFPKLQFLFATVGWGSYCLQKLANATKNVKGEEKFRHLWLFMWEMGQSGLAKPSGCTGVPFILCVLEMYTLILMI